MKNVLRNLLKEAADYTLEKKKGKVTGIELNPEYEGEYRRFREGVGTAGGALAGGLAGHIATDKWADDPLTGAMGTFGGALAGGGLGFGAAAKTNDKAIKKLKQKLKNMG